jgi:hypothetical protein
VVLFCPARPRRAARTFKIGTASLELPDAPAALSLDFAWSSFLFFSEKRCCLNPSIPISLLSTMAAIASLALTAVPVVRRSGACGSAGAAPFFALQSAPARPGLCL